MWKAKVCGEPRCVKSYRVWRANVCGELRGCGELKCVWRARGGEELEHVESQQYGVFRLLSEISSQVKTRISKARFFARASPRTPQSLILARFGHSLPTAFPWK